MKKDASVYNLSKELLTTSNARLADINVQENKVDEIEKAVSYWWALGNQMSKYSQKLSDEYSNESYFRVRSQMVFSNYLLDKDTRYLIGLFNQGLPTVITHKWL